MPPKRRAQPVYDPNTDGDVEPDDKGEAAGTVMRRIQQVKQRRDKRRKEIHAELDGHINDTASKQQAMFDQHKTRLRLLRQVGHKIVYRAAPSADEGTVYSVKMQEDKITRLAEAIRSRDNVAQAIAKKLQEIQNEFLNFTTQLNAVYKGRHQLAKETMDQLSNSEEQQDISQTEEASHDRGRPARQSQHTSIAQRLRN